MTAYTEALTLLAECVAETSDELRARILTLLDEQEVSYVYAGRGIRASGFPEHDEDRTTVCAICREELDDDADTED